MPDTLRCAFDNFSAQFAAGHAQLVWHWIPADLETPVSAYLKLCSDEPYGFLFESVEGGTVLGRYSIIGLAPDLIWRCRGQAVEIQHDGRNPEKSESGPVESLRAMLQESRIEDIPEELPPMAASGLFGYIGYDMVRLIEDIPDENPDDLALPDSVLIRPTALAIFDNIKNMICVVTPVYTHKNNSDQSAQQVFDAAQARINQLETALNAPVPAKLLHPQTGLSLPLPVTSNMDKADYKSAVSQAVDYIHQGEIFQAVLAQRFSTDFDLPPFELYRTLRRLNPSPFLFYLNMDGFSLVGSSPEILVRVRDNTVTIRPIAGTRRRGVSPAEDKALADELLADPKERAEHLMLLDLGRNDVGRVAAFGSIEVTDQFMIEYYSHVMHIVSNVEGRLRPDVDIVDALFAGFPAGTVSGAPKVRAMEIIDELETVRRGYYGGGIGYFSGNGTLDTCIALRTALVKDGKLYVQAGAGIVADSDPDAEHQECVNKAQAVIRAAEAALEQAHPENAPHAKAPPRQKQAS